MTYTEGQLLCFTPFIFKNGAKPKKKYFIVLKHFDEYMVLASLPTPKDHLPKNSSISSGCINIPERAINAYVFLPNESVTKSFCFSLPTFVYGEQVDEYNLKYLNGMDTEIEDLGIIHDNLFFQLKECLKQSVLIKRKFRKLL